MSNRFITISLTTTLILLICVFTNLLPVKEREINFNDSKIRCIMKKDTIPYSVVIVISAIYALLPLFWIEIRKMHRFILFVHSIQAHLSTFIITNICKSFVGKLRPDFIERCDPIDNLCTGDKSEISEGRKSFPSGHTSTINCAFGFYLIILVKYKKMNAFNIIFLIMLLFFSVFVSLSRIMDNKHFPSDVIWGFNIGLFFSIFFVATCAKMIKTNN